MKKSTLIRLFIAVLLLADTIGVAPSNRTAMNSLIRVDFFMFNNVCELMYLLIFYDF